MRFPWRRFSLLCSNQHALRLTSHETEIQMPFDPAPLLLTFKLAAVTTLILLVVGVLVAYWLAFHRFRLKPVCEAVVAMPLVLPPTVLGFYLLLLLGHNNPLSRLLGGGHFQGFQSDHYEGQLGRASVPAPLEGACGQASIVYSLLHKK